MLYDSNFLFSVLTNHASMKTCLFCLSTGSFSTIEHIIPESLGNDDLILCGEVCDSCQNYFGKEIEQFVLAKTPIAFWRTYLGIETKKGKLPSVDLSQPKMDKGIFPSTHPMHDNIGFAYHNDGSVSVDIDNPELIREIRNGKKENFVFVFSPKVLHMFGRFLCKIGVELLCKVDPDEARSEIFEKARRYARFGELNGLWPIFHFSNRTVTELKEYEKDELGYLEKVDCYAYSLFLYKDYWLLKFAIGTDVWIISLNDPYPNPCIQDAFPGSKLDLI